jgi:ribonuclease G
MSKELVISANRHETKVGILEDDQLVEVFFQRANEYSLAGSIHKGRVTRVLPGMQSAFVDLGLERDTFLYVSDFSDETEDFDRIAVTREPARPERGSRPPAEKPLVAEAGSAAESPEAAGGAVSAAAATETEAAAAPHSERGEQRPDRERGRRSRRRRGRGRGFPESKYASDVTRPPRFSQAPSAAGLASVAAPAVESSPHAVSAGASDFSVLPGESLAKYTRAPAHPEPYSEFEAEEKPREFEEPTEARAEMIVEVTEEASEEPDEAPLAEESELIAAEELSDSEASDSEVSDDEPSDAEQALEAGVEIVAASEILASEPIEEIDSIDVETEAPDELETEPAALETLPGESRAAAQDASQASAPPLSAQVREQGGRFPHRMPRRMRRRMRGGGQGDFRSNEGRPEQREEPAAFSEAGAPKSAPRSEERSVSRPERTPLPSITELLKEGQEIIVQIAKEPLGQKGARITSHIALPGRYVVYMPTLEHTGVSRKIASDEERQRLKRILQIHHAGIPGGFIVRTAGEGKTEEELAADMNFLFNLWLDIRQKAEKRPAPLLLHHDLDIVQRTLRDQFTEDFKAIWVDNEELYESVLRFVQRFQPALVARVKLYTRPEPIFDAFNITAELEKALRPKVWLKSGGHIVINQTEALVAIDVNTGKYVGRSNRLEDTIVKTNTEAVQEIVRQIRLRDLGGIIVVDFIDMDERKNRQKVMQALEDAMRSDRAPYKILQFNDFGLVAITRKRVKQSLERALCMSCPHCEGAGYVKSVQTVVSEILQEASKLAGTVEGKDALLRVHPDVAKVLKSNQNQYLEELEELLHRPVLVKADPLLHHEKFDLG